MTERPFPPTPEPALRVKALTVLGEAVLQVCGTSDPDYAQFSLNQMHDYVRADRRAAAPAAQPKGQRLYRTEAEAADELLKLLFPDLTPDDLRTDGGSVNMPKVRALLTERRAAAPAAQPEQSQQVLVVTNAMVDAYLKANDAYWLITDEIPRPPGKSRTGTPQEATRVGLHAAIDAMLAPAPQEPAPAQPACPRGHSWRDFGALGGRNVVWCNRCDAIAFTGTETDAPPAQPVQAEPVTSADDDLPRLVHEAFGEASMMWQPIPSGVFKSSEASAAAWRLINAIRATAPPVRDPAWVEEALSLAYGLRQAGWHDFDTKRAALRKHLES